MRKKIISLSLVLVFLLCIAAQASGPQKAPTAKPELSFENTTATCAATIRGDRPQDKIVATARLWAGSTCLKTWNRSGINFLFIKEKATITRGKTYTLTVDYTVNGIKQPQRSVTKTCP